MGGGVCGRSPARRCGFFVAALSVGAAVGGGAALADDDTATGGATVDQVIVTARLRPEQAQAVPGALSVVTGKTLTTTQTYDVTQLSQLVPSVNYSSPNPRNTALTIRGLGSSVVAIAQANDGLEPGVGFYVDQVYHARPAAAAFDFLDVDHIEVLRGPQGTVFGKNTTAGAISIFTKAPTFDTEAMGEVTGGNYDYFQAKASVSGPIIGSVVAGRLSILATQRDGLLHNVTTGGRDNNVNDLSIHGQLLIRPRDNLSLRLSADDNRIDDICCTQVFVRVGTSLKPAAAQYPALAAGVAYAPPSLDPYDRLTDIDAPLKVKTDEGGFSGTAEWDLGKATVTSISAWRWWNWDAANDRDYTSLSIQTQQHIPSRQDQWSQELRIASNGRQRLEYVAGLYWFRQVITGEPITQYGPLATYWLLGKPPAFPANLLDGYITDGHTRFASNSYAGFGEVTWRITERFNLTGGLRYTAEDKQGTFASTVSGGGTPLTPAQATAKLSILRPQAYAASVNDGDLSGRAVASYDLTDGVMAYASYARTGKSGGINMSGLPLNAANQPALNTAVVKPEKNTTWEIGLKSRLLGDHLILNADYFDTTIHDFQANVIDTGPGALRGYLANISLVRDQGVELDAQAVVDEHLSAHLSVAWTDGRYVSYKDAPCPLELLASSTSVCDLSGKPLTGLPKWAWSGGGEYTHAASLGSVSGEAYLHTELTVRTSVYGDPSDSRYAIIGGYTLVNASLGFRAANWEASIWARNLFNANYLQNVTIQAGNSGLVVGTPGDPQTFGATLRVHY
jgi:iron complex outermembrane recepter protein